MQRRCFKAAKKNTYIYLEATVNMMQGETLQKQTSQHGRVTDSEVRELRSEEECYN